MYKVLKIITGRYPPYILPRLPLCCHAMWKFENSECSIFKMKDVTGLKTFTKMYCSVHFNLVYSSEVSKTPLRQIDDDRSRLLETPNHSPGIFHRKWGGRAPPTRPTPLRGERIARFARIRLLRYALPISLHILRKIRTDLQSRHTAGFTVRYLLKGARCFQCFNFPFAELNANQPLAG